MATDQERELLPPSGRQHEIRLGSLRAVVTEVGAALRVFTVEGVDVVDGFPLDHRASGGRGQVLAPWPNRLGEGRFTYDDQLCRAGLDEPQRSNAIHGLVRWLPWHVRQQTDDAVSLSCMLHPQPGYLWTLEIGLTYQLVDHGLTATANVTNRSATRAPFGIGFHPYLTVGTPAIDTTRLVVPARRRILTNRRCLPVGDEPVAGTDYDFTTEREVGSLQLDTGYTDLVRDDDGIATVRLRSSDGQRSIALWVDGNFGYLMVYTGDTLGPAEARRRSIAIEPMSCPPDAMRSAADVITIEPGGSWSGAWGITVDD